MFTGCPASTWPCPSGTFNPYPNRQNASQCSPCSPGQYCPTPGATAPIGTCAPGYYCVSRATVSNPPMVRCECQCPLTDALLGFVHWHQAPCNSDRQKKMATLFGQTKRQVYLPKTDGHKDKSYGQNHGSQVKWLEYNIFLRNHGQEKDHH